MKVITLHGPWAGAVIWAGKDIENRGWKPAAALQPGDLLAIHAARSRPKKADVARVKFLGRGFELAPDLYGAIIGVVTYAGWIPAFVGAGLRTEDYSKWAQYGHSVYWWRFANPKPLKNPIYTKGNQQLWSYDTDAILKELTNG